MSRSGKEAQQREPLDGRTPSREDFIYFAGLFDGEGSIDLSTGRIRTPRLKVSMTDGPTLDWLFETFGGNVCNDNPSGTGKLQAWKWYSIRQADVRAILDGTLPYLKLKRDRGLAAMDLLNYLKAAYGPCYSDDGWLNELHRLAEQCFARTWQQRPSVIVAAKAQDREAQAA